MAALVAVMLLAMPLTEWAQVRVAAPWQVRVEVASFRLSISGGAPAVRNRSVLFDIGQSLVRRLAAR